MINVQIIKYSLIGVVNTLLHWGVFYLLTLLALSSAMANLLAFLCAVTFSFFADAKWTFERMVSLKRYLLFIMLMGSLALSVGWIIDYLKQPALFAVILFSLISWILGFLGAKNWVFK